MFDKYRVPFTVITEKDVVAGSTTIADAGEVAVIARHAEVIVEPEVQRSRRQFPEP